MALPPEGEPGSIRTLLSSAVNAIYLRERFLPLEAQHGGARSRGLSFRKNDWGVYIFGLHLARTRLTIQPVQIDDRPRSKILRTSQCRLHTPNLKAKLTRSDATDVRQRAPTLRESDADRRATSSAKLTRSDATDVRQRAPMLRESDADRRATRPRARIKGANRQGWGLGNILQSVLAMVNRQMTVFG